MADNFDQLFKAKIESKNYAYQAKAWRLFSKKAGWSAGLSTAATVSIATLSAVIFAVGGYFTYQHFTPAPKGMPTPQEMVSHVDTLPTTQPLAPASVEDTLTPIQQTESKPIEQKKQAKPNKQAAPVEVPSAPTDTMATPQPAKKYILRPRPSRRILEINTDTIKSND